jgi:hypothetical protein
MKKYRGKNEAHPCSPSEAAQPANNGNFAIRRLFIFAASGFETVIRLDRTPKFTIFDETMERVEQSTVAQGLNRLIAVVDHIKPLMPAFH